MRGHSASKLSIRFNSLNQKMIYFNIYMIHLIEPKTVFRPGVWGSILYKYMQFISNVPVNDKWYIDKFLLVNGEGFFL